MPDLEPIAPCSPTQFAASVTIKKHQWRIVISRGSQNVQLAFPDGLFYIPRAVIALAATAMEAVDEAPACSWADGCERPAVLVRTVHSGMAAQSYALCAPHGVADASILRFDDATLAETDEYLYTQEGAST